MGERCTGRWVKKGRVDAFGVVNNLAFYNVKLLFTPTGKHDKIEGITNNVDVVVLKHRKQIFPPKVKKSAAMLHDFFCKIGCTVAQIIIS